MTSDSFSFLLLIVFQIAIVQINGQFCKPDLVQNIIYKDLKLSWSLPINETCTISYFIVRINSAPDYEVFTFETDETTLDVSHVPDCANTWFGVVAVSTDNIQGDAALLNGRGPEPPEANIKLEYLRLSSTSDSTVMLQWSVDKEWGHCVARLRVLRYNEDDDETVSRYLIGGMSTYEYEVIPCTSYVFTVTPLYDLDREGPISLVRYNAPTSKIPSPEVTRFSVGTTTVDLTVNLVRPDINRCPVTALIVDSSPYFNVSYPITGQSQITRPPMSVRLTNLQPDSFYWLRVFANSTGGPSDPYIIGIQTLPN